MVQGSDTVWVGEHDYFGRAPGLQIIILEAFFRFVLMHKVPLLKEPMYDENLCMHPSCDLVEGKGHH